MLENFGGRAVGRMPVAVNHEQFLVMKFLGASCAMFLGWAANLSSAIASSCYKDIGKLIASIYAHIY